MTDKEMIPAPSEGEVGTPRDDAVQICAVFGISAKRSKMDGKEGIEYRKGSSWTFIPDRASQLERLPSPESPAESEIKEAITTYAKAVGVAAAVPNAQTINDAHDAHEKLQSLLSLIRRSSARPRAIEWEDRGRESLGRVGGSLYFTIGKGESKCRLVSLTLSVDVMGDSIPELKQEAKKKLAGFVTAITEKV